MSYDNQSLPDTAAMTGIRGAPPGQAEQVDARQIGQQRSREYC
jgi:hypothetical protein